MSKKRSGNRAGVRLADGRAQAKQDRAVLEARVIRVDDMMGSFMGYMPNPDEVLRDTGEALCVYREMKTDSRVKSLLTVVKSAVLNFPIRLEKGDASDAVMAYTEGAVKRLPLDGIAKRLLSAVDYGYAVVELVWELSGSTWSPADAVLRKPERFSFDAEGQLRYRRLGETIDLYRQDYKWLVFRHDKDAENPYGTSALKSCYWPWKFKKAGAEFWLMATEKFSVPSVLALFESSEGEEKTQERAAKLSEMLAHIGSGSGAALANIKDVKALEVKGDLSEFKALMDWCDTQIAYGIVYQSLAVQEAQNGTRAQAEVHADLFAATAKTICRDIQSVLQRAVDWAVELNYGPGVVAPRVEFDLADYASFEEVCKAVDSGIPVSLSALYERYGLPEPANDSDSFVKDAQAALPDAPPGSPVPGKVQPVSDVQSTALNGAQVASLVDLAAQVSQGALPIDTARAIAASAFPLVKNEEIDAIFAPLVGFKPTAVVNLSDSQGKKKAVSLIPRQR